MSLPAGFHSVSGRTSRSPTTWRGPQRGNGRESITSPRYGRGTRRPTGRAFGRHWSVDPRLGCWEDVVGLVEVVRPTVVLSESVPAIESYGKPFLDTVVRRLGDAGYGGWG